MDKTEYMKNVSKEILKLVEEYEKEGRLFVKGDLPERMNSYEWNLCLPLLCNEYLIENVKYYIEQSMGEFREGYKYTLDGTYNDTLKRKLIHILIKRIEKLDKPITKYHTVPSYSFNEVCDYFNKKYNIDLNVEGGENSFWHWICGQTDVQKGRNFRLDVDDCNEIPEFAQKIIDILLKDGFDDEVKRMFVFYYDD